MKIRLTKHKGGLYTLYTQYEVNTQISKAWIFFTKVSNIEQIMPPEMNFNVTSSKPTNIYEGKIITFNTKITPFYSTNIISEIKKYLMKNILLINKFLDHTKSGIMNTILKKQKIILQ